MIRTFITAAAIILTATNLVYQPAPKYNYLNEYPETFIVDRVDRENDVLYLETFSGNVFTWNSCEDWEPGDIASAIMNSNGTEEVKDDTIIMLKYSGYIY